VRGFCRARHQPARAGPSSRADRDRDNEGIIMADTAPIEMRDAADWNAAGLANWHGPVAGYPNRQPPWPPSAFRKFSRVMRISVQTEAHWAQHCREIDVESGAAAPTDIPPFIHAREAAGHADGGAYFSLANWPDVSAALLAADIAPHRIRLRIADWTGKPRRIVLDAGGLKWTAWAHQFENVPDLGIDRSMIWGAQDFTR
jgi:hypothetical protein